MIQQPDFKKNAPVKLNMNIHQIIFSYFTAFEQFTKCTRLSKRERKAIVNNKENPEYPSRNLQINQLNSEFWISIDNIKSLHEFSHHFTLKITNSATNWAL